MSFQVNAGGRLPVRIPLIDLFALNNDNPNVPAAELLSLYMRVRCLPLRSVRVRDSENWKLCLFLCVNVYVCMHQCMHMRPGMHVCVHRCTAQVHICEVVACEIVCVSVCWSVPPSVIDFPTSNRKQQEGDSQERATAIYDTLRHCSTGIAAFLFEKSRDMMKRYKLSSAKSSSAAQQCATIVRQEK